MDWTTEQLLLAQSPNVASAMQSLVTWLDGMPIEGPILPSVDPMASLPALPPVTAATPGVTEILPGNMPLTGPLPTGTPVTLNDQGQFISASPVGLPVAPAQPAMLSAPVTAPTLTTTQEPQPTSTVATVLFGNDHGSGN